MPTLQISPMWDYKGNVLSKEQSVPHIRIDKWLASTAYKTFAVSEAADTFNSTFIVSRQPCSSARTVTMSSMQPENNRGAAVWGSQESAPLHTSSHNNVLLHSPKVKMNFSLSLISIFCSSRLPCKWNPQELEMKAMIIRTEESETQQNF